jgi:ABC-type uncharacterized transport system auxiliary subunit
MKLWIAPPALAAALLAVLGASCSGPTEPTTYSLPLTRVASLSETPLSSEAVMVEGFGSDAVLGHRALAWREAAAPNEIHTYSRHLWSQAPPRIVQDHIVSCLRSANAFALVTYPYERSETSLVLGGELRRFEQSIDQNGASAALITVDISLSDRTRRRVALQERLTIDAVAEDGTPQAAIIAFRNALRGLCEQLLVRFN